MARHVDFEKIRAAFLAHYSKDPLFGESRYVEWVKDSDLDESKSYYAQAASLCKCKQSFQWAQFLIEFVKEDHEARYYKVEALFPVESMNGAVFTHDEVLQSARSLTGKPSNLNHDPAQLLKEVEVVAAQGQILEATADLLRISGLSIAFGIEGWANFVRQKHER